MGGVRKWYRDERNDGGRNHGEKARPVRGPKVRMILRNAPKNTASRFYQLLCRHTVAAPLLKGGWALVYARNITLKSILSGKGKKAEEILGNTGGSG